MVALENSARLTADWPGAARIEISNLSLTVASMRSAGIFKNVRFESGLITTTPLVVNDDLSTPSGKFKSCHSISAAFSFAPVLYSGTPGSPEFAKKENFPLANATQHGD